MTLYFVTGSAGKLREVQALLPDREVVAVPIDLPEYQGSPDFITQKKCEEARRVARADQYPLIIEDTGLCLAGLGGQPGPYIKWFLEAMTLDQLVLSLAGSNNYQATAYCSIAYLASPTSSPVLYRGEMTGFIVSPRQSAGPAFGWDPIFQPTGYTQTLAEMTSQEKNQLSHRSQAIRSLLQSGK